MYNFQGIIILTTTEITEYTCVVYSGLDYLFNWQIIINMPRKDAYTDHEKKLTQKQWRNMGMTMKNLQILVPYIAIFFAWSIICEFARL